MEKVIIYKPCKNVMQSGMMNTKQWVLQFTDIHDSKIEGVMGWSSKVGTHNQIKLFFASSQDAIDYAKAHNLSYELLEEVEITRDKKVYSKNFTKDLNLYYY